jgi:dihydroneopterin aldolase
MSDQILVSGLRVMAPVGVLEEERARPQPLSIDCALDVDLAVAGASDDLEDTVNYAEVALLADQLARARHHELLESLADEIASGILGLDDRIEGVEVVVTKLRPPIGLDLATVGVRRARRR